MQSRFAKSLIMGFIMILGLSSASASTLVEVVAPTANVNMFLSNSGVAIPNTSFSNGTHPIYGNVQFLRSGSPGFATGPQTVQQRLQAIPSASGMLINSYTFAGVAHQRVYESGFIGQCVGFAKFMTGATGSTGTWRRGRALANIFPNGQGVSGTANAMLVPGSMIAHFGGQSVYNHVNNKLPHVAIVLSVVQEGNIIRGINVVDQNGMTSATINGVNTTVRSGGGGSIAKHFLPWNANSPTNPQVSAMNYHVVARCPVGQTCP